MILAPPEKLKFARHFFFFFLFHFMPLSFKLGSEILHFYLYFCLFFIPSPKLFHILSFITLS